MNNKRRAGFAIVGLGAVLLLAALLLLLRNGRENKSAGQAADRALSAIEERLAPGGAAAPTALPQLLPSGETFPAETPAVAAPPESPAPGELKALSIDGHDYVGYLAVPALDLKLPVMKPVYMEDLQLAPCLDTGSPYSDDAVIAAHNYDSHFGRLKELKGGEVVTFTDMNGEQISYTVALVQTVAPTDMELVRESGHDLVLYTCTTGGQNRVMVACDRS